MAVLKANNRGEVGSRSVRILREKGLIPAVVYGHGEENINLTLSEHDVEVVILHGGRLLEIDLGGKKHNVLIKDVQYDTFGQKVLHMDLARVNLDERVQVTVPIVLRGTPEGVSEGGMLNQIVSEANVECLVTAIPEELRLSVVEMKIGDQLCMSDMALPDGATLLDTPESVICNVTIMAEEEAVEAEEEAKEPEVMGDKEEKEGEEEQNAGKQ